METRSVLRITTTSSRSLALLFFIVLAALLSFASGYKETAMGKLESVERLLLRTVVGPESLAFDRRGGGPYTGVSGGRILKWQGKGRGWAPFAVNAAKRKGECDGPSTDVSMESACGRPLGLQFHKATGVLYVADAYYGLLAVGPRGGRAELVAASAAGGPFNFTNGVDVDQRTGVVYFTDSSTQYQRPDYILAVLNGDSSGRLMKYDPKTRKVTVLKRGLPFPNGVALSDDRRFLLFAETATCRVIRYWLRGPNATVTEVFAELPGYPDNIRRTPGGDYWVAINRKKVDLNGINVSRINNNVNINVKPSTAEAEEGNPVAVRLSQEGKVVEVLNGGELASVSEVVDGINGTIWVGSVDMPYVDVYKL